METDRHRRSTFPGNIDNKTTCEVDHHNFCVGKQELGLTGVLGGAIACYRVVSLQTLIQDTKETNRNFPTDSYYQSDLSSTPASMDGNDL